MARPKQTPVIDLSTEETASKTLDTAPRQGIIWGQALADNTMVQIAVEFSELVVAMATAGLKIPIIVHTKGAFGPSLGEFTVAQHTIGSGYALWGLIRCVRLEIPAIPITLLDMPYAAPISDIPRYIRPMYIESAYHAGQVYTPSIQKAESIFRMNTEAKPDIPYGIKGDRSDAAKRDKIFNMTKSYNWITSSDHYLDHCWWRQAWTPQGSCDVPIGRPGTGIMRGSFEEPDAVAAS